MNLRKILTRKPLLLSLGLLAVVTLTTGSGCSVGFAATDTVTALPVQPCPGVIRGHGTKTWLPAGVYQCDIVVVGHNNRVVGSRNTIIRGDLIIRGSRNVVQPVTVEGRLRVAGRGNRVNYHHIRGKRVHRYHRTRVVYR